LHKRNYIFLLIFLLFSTKAVASVDLRIAVLGNNAPFSWIEGNIERGIDVDIVREAGKRAGYNILFVMNPWKRMIGALKTGQIDGALPLFYRTEREEFAVFTTVPIRLAQFNMFVPAQESEDRRFPGFHAYRGKIVGKVRGLGVSADFARSAQENEIRLKDVASADQGVQMLVRKRFHGFVNDTLTTQYVIVQMGVGDKIKMLTPGVNKGEGVFVVLSRARFNEDQANVITQKFNKALQRMTEDGTITSIIQ
jgi:polar amino acid transport system substrate-binding protein